MKKTLCLFFALLLTIGLSMPALAGELPVLQLSVEGGSLTLTSVSYTHLLGDQLALTDAQQAIPLHYPLGNALANLNIPVW